jgi:hypothetical protein
MARPRVADGMDGLQLEVALGVGLTTPHKKKKQIHYEKLHKASDLD